MSLIFNRDFDLELALEQQEARGETRPRHSAEDLAAAVAAARAEGLAEGWRSGHIAGLSDAAALDAARRAAALEVLVPQVQSLMAATESHRVALEAQLMDFALSICEHVFPELLTRRAHDRALAQIRRALSLGLGSTTLRVSLSADALDLLRDDLEATIAALGLEGRVELLADAGLGAGDVHVGWDDGVLEYSFSTICERILAVLRAARSAAPTPCLEH
jgi:flagellar assembly protein FliH